MRTIGAIGDSGALLLTPEVLEQVGMQVGDEVDVSVLDRTLIVRPLADVEREEAFTAAMNYVLKRHKRLYEALAKGPEWVARRPLNVPLDHPARLRHPRQHVAGQHPPRADRLARQLAGQAVEVRGGDRGVERGHPLGR